MAGEDRKNGGGRSRASGMRPLRIVIGEPEFRQRVDARPVPLRSASGAEVQAILSDIGWSRMMMAITDAMAGQRVASGFFEPPPPEEPPPDQEGEFEP